LFKDKVILITGGSGFLGNGIVKRLIPLKPKKIIIYSRSEYKQHLMTREYDYLGMRYLLGDVRDLDRLTMALKDVDYVIHCAALKRIPELEYNCIEGVQTNINGSMNVIRAAILNNVKKVVAISTDKSTAPLNLYGSSKLVMEKLMINANALSHGKTIFSCIKYGNVANSTGSVIPYFKELIAQGQKILPITDERMTRFHITIDQGIDLIFTAFREMQGGEIFVAKIPSFKITDLVKSLSCAFKVIGIRPGEKLHEIMITTEDAPRTYDCGDYYTIQPDFDWIESREFKGIKVPEGFSYSSDKNIDWLYQ
jgi:UDP-N-acetylglucosamine 4,6-dehydratase/5-epimerase